MAFPLSFTLIDPFEDTESTAGAHIERICHRFTLIDPFEDTESIGKAFAPHASICFTLIDPFEDTERRPSLHKYAVR